jgi:hypothetical protein
VVYVVPVAVVVVVVAVVAVAVKVNQLIVTHNSIEHLMQYLY